MLLIPRYGRHFPENIRFKVFGIYKGSAVRVCSEFSLWRDNVSLWGATCVLSWSAPVSAPNCSRNEQWAPELPHRPSVEAWMEMGQSEPLPWSWECDRKLNYSWTVSVNADTNRWHCVALGTEEAALWKIIDREFCWSLTGFPVLGSSHSREPAVLGYIITHCMLSRFSHVWHFVTPWTVAYQAPLSMGILQASILGWVAMPSSRGSSRPRDQTRICYVSCESLLEIPF